MVYADQEPVSAQSQEPPAYTYPLERTRFELGNETDVAQFISTGLVDTGRPTSLSVGSVEASSVTVHRVRLGSEVQEITVSRSAGVQVGDHNRQLNDYQFKLDRPQVSLEHLLEGHPATRRSLERLAANPDSWRANYAFRQHMSVEPTQPSTRVMFAGASHGPTRRISARVDEYGATVVENSQGVQVGDHATQRNDFSYQLARQEISLSQMLHDRPDLVRGLAMTIRHPDNPAVERSFTHRLSDAYTHRNEPSLRILNEYWPGRDPSVEYGAGVQVGRDLSRTDRISVEIRRLALTGWESTAEQIAAKIEEPATPRASIDEPDISRSFADLPVVHLDSDIPWTEPFRHGVLDHADGFPDPADAYPDPADDLGL